MATYRKPLKDIDGNFIIPAMTGDQTEWIQTGDIADGAVTADKIDFTTFISNTVVTPAANFQVSSFAVADRLSVKKFGNVCFLQGRIDTTASIASGYIAVCEFPSSLAPHTTLSLVGTSSSSACFRIDIDNQGKVYAVSHAFQSSERMTLSFSWLVS